MPSLKSNADNRLIGQQSKLVPFLIITMDKCSTSWRVTGYDSLDFWCYWPGNPALLIPVPRNLDYIQRLLNRELEFWNLIQRTS